MDQPKELGVGGVDKTIESTHCKYITYVNVLTYVSIDIIQHNLLQN